MHQEFEMVRRKQEESSIMYAELPISSLCSELTMKMFADGEREMSERKKKWFDSADGNYARRLRCHVESGDSSPSVDRRSDRLPSYEETADSTAVSKGLENDYLIHYRVRAFAERNA